jgi:hypothetical protein
VLSLGRNVPFESTTHLMRSKVSKSPGVEYRPRWLRDSYGLPPVHKGGEAMAPFLGNPDNLDRATLDLLDRAFTDVWSHFQSKQSLGEQAMMRERVRKLASSGERDLERCMRHALFHLEARGISGRKVLHLPV